MIAALAAVLLTYGVNFVFNHTGAGAAAAALPGVYVVVFYLGVGVCVPAVLLRHLQLSGTSFPAVAPGVREWVWTLAALALGALFVYFALSDSQSNIDVAGLVPLFFGLLIASTAEVLVFIGVLFNCVQRSLTARGTVVSLLAAALASCMAFGFFHLTYPAPWNSVSMCLLLSVIWVGVVFVYSLSGSLLAAIVFNNLMALIGFVQNDLTLPVGSMTGAGLFVLALVVLFAIGRQSAPGTQP